MWCCAFASEYAVLWCTEIGGALKLAEEPHFSEQSYFL